MNARRWFAAFAVAWCTQLGTSYGFDFDWLDKLSGPGPFSGLYVSYRFMCLSKSSDQLPVDLESLEANPTRRTALVEGFRRLRGTRDMTHVTWQKPLARSSGLLPIQRLPQTPRFLSASSDEDAQDKAKQDAAIDGVIQAYLRDAPAFNCLNDRQLRNYLTFGVAYIRSKENNLFPDDPESAFHAVGMTQVEMGLGTRLHRAFDIMSSVGVARFSGTAFNDFTRLTITPVSFDFAPLAFVKDDHRHRAVKLSLGWTMFFGGFSAADFCNANECSGARTFDSRFEVVTRMILKVDPVLFFP